MWIYIPCACLMPVEAKSSVGGESHRTGVTVVVSCLVVLEIKPGSFERSESALHCPAIHFSNPCEYVFFCIFYFFKIGFQAGPKLKLQVLLLLPPILSIAQEKGMDTMMALNDTFQRPGRGGARL